MCYIMHRPHAVLPDVAVSDDWLEMTYLPATMPFSTMSSCSCCIGPNLYKLGRYECRPSSWLSPTRRGKGALEGNGRLLLLNRVKITIESRCSLLWLWTLFERKCLHHAVEVRLYLGVKRYVMHLCDDVQNDRIWECVPVATFTANHGACYE